MSTVFPKIAKLGEKKIAKLGEKKQEQRKRIAKGVTVKHETFQGQKTSESDLSFKNARPETFQLQGQGTAAVNFPNIDDAGGKDANLGQSLHSSGPFLPSLLGQSRDTHGSMPTRIKLKHVELEIEGRDIQSLLSSTGEGEDKDSAPSPQVIDTEKLRNETSPAARAEKDRKSLKEDLQKILECHSLGLPLEIAKRDYNPGRFVRPLFHCNRCMEHWTSYGIVPDDCNDTSGQPVRGPGFNITDKTTRLLRTFQKLQRYSHTDINQEIDHLLSRILDDNTDDTKTEIPLDEKESTKTLDSEAPADMNKYHGANVAEVKPLVALESRESTPSRFTPPASPLQSRVNQRQSIHGAPLQSSESKRHWQSAAKLNKSPSMTKSRSRIPVKTKVSKSGKTDRQAPSRPTQDSKQRSSQSEMSQGNLLSFYSDDDEEVFVWNASTTELKDYYDTLLEKDTEFDGKSNEIEDKVREEECTSPLHDDQQDNKTYNIQKNDGRVESFGANYFQTGDPMYDKWTRGKEQSKAGKKTRKRRKKKRVKSQEPVVVMGAGMGSDVESDTSTYDDTDDEDDTDVNLPQDLMEKAILMDTGKKPESQTDSTRMTKEVDKEKTKIQLESTGRIRALFTEVDRNKEQEQFSKGEATQAKTGSSEELKSVKAAVQPSQRAVHVYTDKSRTLAEEHRGSSNSKQVIPSNFDLRSRSSVKPLPVGPQAPSIPIRNPAVKNRKGVPQTKAGKLMGNILGVETSATTKQSAAHMSRETQPPESRYVTKPQTSTEQTQMERKQSVSAAARPSTRGMSRRKSSVAGESTIDMTKKEHQKTSEYSKTTGEKERIKMPEVQTDDSKTDETDRRVLKLPGQSRRKSIVAESANTNLLKSSTSIPQDSVKPTSARSPRTSALAGVATPKMKMTTSRTLSTLPKSSPSNNAHRVIKTDGNSQMKATVDVTLSIDIGQKSAEERTMPDDSGERSMAEDSDMESETDTESTYTGGSSVSLSSMEELPKSAPPPAELSVMAFSSSFNFSFFPLLVQNKQHMPMDTSVPKPKLAKKKTKKKSKKGKDSQKEPKKPKKNKIASFARKMERRILNPSPLKLYLRQMRDKTRAERNAAENAAVLEEEIEPKLSVVMEEGNTDLAKNINALVLEECPEELSTVNGNEPMANQTQANAAEDIKDSGQLIPQYTAQSEHEV